MPFTLDWLLSPVVLAYNIPALALLAWMLYRRFFWGGVLTVMVYFRVIDPIIGFSMHACISMVAALTLPRYERLFGVGLGLFTAYWQLLRWNVPLDFYGGLAVGAVLGAACLLTRSYWAYLRTPQPSASKAS
jgi:hypothetical protein